MSQNLILVPVFFQVMLTVAVLILLGRARGSSMRERGQSLDDVALAKGPDWNEQARKVANNLANQFELPVLFYVVCAFALITRTVDGVMVGAASVFVLSRIVHAMIHIGPNKVAWRGSVWLVGLVMLVVLWVLVM